MSRIQVWSNMWASDDKMMILFFFPLSTDFFCWLSVKTRSFLGKLSLNLWVCRVSTVTASSFSTQVFNSASITEEMDRDVSLKSSGGWIQRRRQRRCDHYSQREAKNRHVLLLMSIRNPTWHSCRILIFAFSFNYSWKEDHLKSGKPDAVMNARYVHCGGMHACCLHTMSQFKAHYE